MEPLSPTPSVPESPDDAPSKHTRAVTKGALNKGKEAKTEAKTEASNSKALELGGLPSGLSLSTQSSMIKSSTISGAELYLHKDVPDHMLPGLLGWKRATENWETNPELYKTAMESDEDKKARLESEQGKRDVLRIAYAEWNLMTKEEQENRRKWEDEQRR